MKFNLSSDVLNYCLDRIKGGLSTINESAKLIKFVAKDNKLIVYTNSIRVGYKCELTGDLVTIEEDGEVIFDGALFLKFCKKLSKDIIYFNRNKSITEVLCGNKKMKFSVLDNYFLEVKDVVGDEIKVETTPLQIAIEACLQVADKGSDRFDCVRLSKDKVSATNGVAMSIIEDVTLDIEIPIFINYEAAKDLLKFLDHELVMKTDGSFLSIRFKGFSDENDILFVCQLLNDSFPLLPIDETSYDESFRFIVEDLSQSLDFVALDLSEGNYLELNLDESLLLKSIDNDKVETSINVEIGWDSFGANAENINLHFMVTKFRNVINSLKTFVKYKDNLTGEIALMFSNDSKAVLFKTEGMMVLLSKAVVY